ncbi:MAG TPA: ATP-binding protein, partial [Polyangia bacterium]
PDAAGTGLGLSIVKRVAEASGGSVTVRSTLGRGSTFVIKLPIAE